MSSFFVDVEDDDNDDMLAFLLLLLLYMMLLSLIDLFVGDVSQVFVSCFSIHRSCLNVAITVVVVDAFDDCKGTTMFSPSQSFVNEIVMLIGLFIISRKDERCQLILYKREREKIIRSK